MIKHITVEIINKTAMGAYWSSTGETLCSLAAGPENEFGKIGAIKLNHNIAKKKCQTKFTGVQIDFKGSYWRRSWRVVGQSEKAHVRPIPLKYSQRVPLQVILGT
jgi:uncharacterized protein YraI